MSGSDVFRGVLPFVAVVEEKSFRGAAARLGVTTAAVSKAVKTLEAELGVALLVRTSRAVSTTREGELFYERTKSAVAAVSGARAAVAGSRKEPQGKLSISVPFLLAPIVASALAPLASRHPRLAFELEVSDELARFAESGVDLAVRIGSLEDSSLVGRRLRRTRWVTVASPGYLARRGTPSRPEELEGHDLLLFVAPDGRPRTFRFETSHAPFHANERLRVDHGPTLLDAAVAGLGVAQVLDFMVPTLVREGRLVEILSAHAAEGPDLTALAAPGRARSSGVRVLMEALVAGFSSLPSVPSRNA